MEITQISTEQLDNLFGQETEVTTPVEETYEQAPSFDGSLPTIDLDFLDKPDEVISTEETTEDTEEKPKEKTPVEEIKEEEAPKADSDDVKEVLKNTVAFLIEKGKWQDFDGREDMEFTMDVYSELALKQNEASAIEMFNELVDGTGSYGKAIIAHIKEGGNPDELIDLFKEQKQLEAINTNSDEGKLTKIQKYYSEVIGWKPEKVKKHLDRIISDNEIDSELVDVNEKYDEFYQEQLQQLEVERVEKEKAYQENQRIFSDKIKDAIYSNKDYTDKEKRVLENSILTFKHKLENGSKVNDFYVKFAEMQADPKQYVKLVHFVTDPEGFETKLKKQTETKATIKSFNFIKGNNTISKDKGSTHVNAERDSKKTSIDFSTIIKPRK